MLLGALASVLIGVSDYFGRYCSRRAQAMTTVATAFVGGLAAVVVLVFLVPSSVSTGAIAYGAASGALMALGLSAMWHSMAVSSAAIASPIVAAFTAFGPLTYGVAVGERPSTVAAAGIAVTIAGLLGAVIVPDLRGRLAEGIAFALLAGISFAAATVLLGETNVDSGMWPAVSQRMTAFACMLAVTSLGRTPLILPRGLRLAGLAGGITGAVGMGAFISGLQRGPLSEVAVAGSLYPIVTIGLAVMFDDDTLRWWQSIGIAAALIGTVMIAVG